MSWFRTVCFFDVAMKGFVTMAPQIRTSACTTTSARLRCFGARRLYTFSPADAARQLKFVIQQEVKTGCQNKPGFSTKLSELVGASDIQLSEVSLQTLEQYPHCNLHDRQVVLRALLQQRLSAVLACPPDEQVADVKEDGISDGVSDAESETALCHSGNNGRWSSVTAAPDNSLPSSPSSHDGQREHPAGKLQPVSSVDAPQLRSWGSTWQGASQAPMPLWRSSILNATDSSEAADTPTQRSLDPHQQVQGNGGHSRAGTRSSVAQADAAAAPPASSGSGSSAASAVNPSSKTATAAAHNYDRATICAHPTPSFGASMRVPRATDHAGAAHPNTAPAGPQLAPHSPVSPQVGAPAELAPVQQPTLQPASHHDAAAQQPDDARAVQAHSAGPAGLSSAPSAQPAHPSVGMIRNGIGSANRATSSTHDAASPSSRPAAGGKGAPAPRSSSSAGRPQQSSASDVIRAFSPFENESDPWFCTQLFGPERAHTPHTPLEVRVDRMGYAPQPDGQRSLLQVSLPGSTMIDYRLPSLTAAEAAFITNVERRIQAATYNADRVVPIFWDTETTGFSSVEWWNTNSSRIVQLGALTDCNHGSLEFKRDINPHPVEMSPGAAKTTHLSTQKVWSSHICTQVGMAEFLSFCQDVSEANGNARPLLVAHNSMFDNSMLLRNCWQAGIQVPGSWRSLCTLKVAKGLAQDSPRFTIENNQLSTVAKYFGSTVAQGDLHDALEDARQVPIIVEGLEKLGGPKYSLAALAAPDCAATSFRATSYDTFARKMRVKITEKLVKLKAIDQKATASLPTASSRQSYYGRGQHAAISPSNTSRGVGSRGAPLEVAAGGGGTGRQAAVLQAHSPASRESSNGHSGTESYTGQVDASQTGRGSSGGARTLVETPPLAAADLATSPGDTLSEESCYGADISSGHRGSSAVQSSEDGGAQAEEWQAQRTVFHEEELDSMLAEHRNQDDKDPFLSAWPKGIVDGDEAEVLSGGMFQRGEIQKAWSPFTQPLEEAGLPRKTFRAPLLSKLADAGFSNVLDLVRHTPRHEKKDYPSVHVEELQGKVSVRGSITGVGRPTSRPTCSMLSFSCRLNLLGDDGTVVERRFESCIFSGRGYKAMFKLEKDAERLREAEAADALVVLVGRFKESKRKSGAGDAYIFNVTDFNTVDDRKESAEVGDEEQEEEDALAVYPSRRGISHSDFSRYIPRALDHIKESLPEVEGEVGESEVPPGDFLPQWVLEDHALMPWLEALSVVHAGLGSGHPAAVRKQARRRMVFNECVLLSLMMLHHRIALQLADRTDEPPVVCNSKTRVATGTAELPYALTGAQQRVLAEILEDMEAPVPMLRLLQGDVGSGKTAVIFLAALAAISSGHQVAILVPNDVLATQHDTFIRGVSQRMPEEHQPVVEVLAGRVGVKRRREVRERLAAGEVDIVIGTTALNNPQEIFNSLGLVVIDEQHRFGVKQRANLVKKNPDAPAPHVLFATATPIPRTVAMTHMSHMTTSTIDELPPGRKPVETSIVKIKTGSDVTDGSRARQQVLERVSEELEAGGSVFWVFPLVDESEHFQDLGSAYQNALQASELLKAEGGLIAEQAVVITGRMSSEAKAVALDAFRAGRCRLLVSTVVIEVGIDVPAATLMVVEHAERFGLLQLHQLRGRVGRSDKPSACLLVTSSKGALPRLQVLEEHSCGKEVADKDLVLRGAGQLFGQRQSGPADMGLGALLLATDLAADETVVTDARAAAAELTRRYGFKELPPPLLAALSGYNMTSLLALKMQDIDIHM